MSEAPDDWDDVTPIYGTYPDGETTAEEREAIRQHLRQQRQNARNKPVTEPTSPVEKKFKALWKSANDKVRTIVTDKRMVTLTQFGNTALDIAAKVGMAKVSGPVAVAGMVLGTIDQLRGSMDVETPDPIQDWINEQEKLSAYNSGIPDLLTSTGAYKSLKLETFAHDKNSKLVGMRDGEELWCFKMSESATVPGKVFSEIHMYRTPNVDLSHIAEALWKTMPSPIAKCTNSSSGFCKLEPVDDSNDPEYVGIHDPVAFAKMIDIYHARNISRSELLIGPPGSGKTSFTRKYARVSGKTLLIVPPDTLGSHSRTDIELFTNMMQPGILLLDDIDRAQGGLAYAMTVVDDLRRAYPKMVVITTCNRITESNTALLRPGRLGERLQFNAPSGEDRISVLKLYFRRYGVDPTGYDLDALSTEMTHPLFTHDYVRFIAEQAVVMTQAELVLCVQETNTWLETIEGIESQADLSGLMKLVRGNAAGDAQPPPSSWPG